MTLPIDQDPPTLWDEEAELTACGEVIDKNGSNLHRLSVDLFATAKGQSLWRAMESLSATGAPIGLRTVSAACGDPENVGAALTFVAGSGFDYALHKLKELRALRALRDALQDGADRVESLGRTALRLPVGKDVQSAIGTLTGSLAAAAAGLNEGARTTPADLVRDMLDEMARVDRGEKTACIPTGFFRLDAILNGGLRPGEMNTIGARTTGGKTALALQVCRNALKSERSVLYGNRELVPGAIRDRFISSEAGFSFLASNGGRGIPEDKRKAFTIAAAAFKSWKLNIRSDLRTVEAIFGEARMTRPDLVVIDHISAFAADTGRKSATLFDVVTYNSNLARDMALDLGIPVLVLSQLGRGAIDAEEIGVHHLKQSGSIEEDSRVVLLLNVVKVVNEDLNRIALTVAKNSHGAQKRIELDFFTKSQRFEEVSAVNPEDCNR